MLRSDLQMNGIKNGGYWLNITIKVHKTNDGIL